MYVKFRWDGDDLLTDNKDTHGMVEGAKPWKLRLGAQFTSRAFFTDTVPNLETMTNDPINNQDERLF